MLVSRPASGADHSSIGAGNDQHRRAWADIGIDRLNHVVDHRQWFTGAVLIKLTLRPIAELGGIAGRGIFARMLNTNKHCPAIGCVDDPCHFAVSRTGQKLRRSFNATVSYRNFTQLGGQNRYGGFDDTHAAMFIVALLAANPSAPRSEFPSTPAGLHAALDGLESESPRLWQAVLALEPWNTVRFPEALLAVARQPLTGLCPTDTDIRDFEDYLDGRLPSTRSRDRDGHASALNGRSFNSALASRQVG